MRWHLVRGCNMFFIFEVMASWVQILIHVLIMYEGQFRNKCKPKILCLIYSNIEYVYIYTYLDELWEHVRFLSGLWAAASKIFENTDVFIQFGQCWSGRLSHDFRGGSFFYVVQDFLHYQLFVIVMVLIESVDVLSSYELFFLYLILILQLNKISLFPIKYPIKNNLINLITTNM